MRGRLARGEAMIIDRKVVLTGSMNWTASAPRTSEGINLVADEAIAAAYAVHWQSPHAVAVPFTRRDDWCRKREIADSEAPLDETGQTTASKRKGVLSRPGEYPRKKLQPPEISGQQPDARNGAPSLVPDIRSSLLLRRAPWAGDP